MITVMNPIYASSENAILPTDKGHPCFETGTIRIQIPAQKYFLGNDIPVKIYSDVSSLMNITLNNPDGKIVQKLLKPKNVP